MTSPVNVLRFQCARCTKNFSTKSGLQGHSIAKRHYECEQCLEIFGDDHGLNQHLKSPVHNNRSLKCPFCRSKFKTPSSIAHHIESGCHKISRHQVTAAVYALQVIPAISIHRRIEGSTTPRLMIEYHATEEAFNGTSYACSQCDRTFRTIRGLDAHLNSPVHDEKEFARPKCGLEVTLVSGLMQHIESGECGIANVSEVEDQMANLTELFSGLLKG